MPESVIGTATQWSITGTDVETTGLIPGRHEVWEWASIHRFRNTKLNDTRSIIQIRPLYPERADEEALQVSRFHERFKVPEGYEAATILTDGTAYPMTREEAIYAINSALTGTILVGSNTAFDAAMLRELIGGAPWHYRVINALELAAGFLVAKGHKIDLPWNSYEISSLLGIKPPNKAEAHSAMPDAEWALRVFDAVNVDGLMRVQ